MAMAMAQRTNTSESNNYDINVFDGNDTLLNVNDLQKRYYADLMKDMNEGGLDGNQIVRVVNTVYGLRGADTVPNNAWYHSIIDRLNGNLEDQAILDKTTELKNILKSSTVGSNTQITNATNVFYESGMNYQNICIKPKDDIHLIFTPASMLDTAGKTQDNRTMFWPTVPVRFTPSFTTAMGFPPEVSWGCEPTADSGGFVVTIDYGSTSAGANRDRVITSLVNPGNRGGFENYSKGNKEKNADINTFLARTPVNNAEIHKILLTKELGDVAQVWTYYAFVLEKGGDFDRTQVVMITTDSVVYYLAVALNLSCIYTGGRAGVESGRCTLKSYVAGPINYNEQLGSVIKNYYENIRAHNLAIRFGLAKIIANLGECEYYRIEGGKKRVTDGSQIARSIFTERDNIKVEKNKLLNEYIDEVDNAIRFLEIKYNEIVETNKTLRPLAKDEYDGILQTYMREIDVYKSRQIVTRLKNKKYTFGIEDLLRQFAGLSEFEPDLSMFDTIMSGGSMNNNNVMKNKQVSGGCNPNMRHNCTIGYQECICIMYIQIILESLDLSVVETKHKGHPYDKDYYYKMMFSVVYDRIVSQINDEMNIMGTSELFGRINEKINHLYGFLDNDSVEFIGNHIAHDNLYFADNSHEIELKKLNSKLQPKQVSSKRFSSKRVSSNRFSSKRFSSKYMPSLAIPSKKIPSKLMPSKQFSAKQRPGDLFKSMVYGGNIYQSPKNKYAKPTTMKKNKNNRHMRKTRKK